MTVIIALLGLGLVIFAHELGHFLGAKLGGLRVKQFALGFGRRLCGIKHGSTDYRINAVPFGGYVMVDGANDEDPGPDARDPRLMENRPVWARAVFTLFGPLFNMVLAGALILAATGARGIPAGHRVEIGEVRTGSPAEEAGLRKGDF